MTFHEAQAAFKAATGEDPHRPVETHPDGWKFGDRISVVANDEQRGLYPGDEGMCVLETVGSEQHGNERLCLSILVDGEDCTREVRTGDIDYA
jgi:ATP-dependent exoDNAse (exonuclease V) alpha subunit